MHKFARFADDRLRPMIDQLLTQVWMFAGFVVLTSLFAELRLVHFVDYFMDKYLTSHRIDVQ